MAFKLIQPVTGARWNDITAHVGELSTPHRTFYTLTGLSTTIAAFGLLANSTAVVIESLASVAGARLSDVHLDQDRDTLRVTAFVYTPRPFEPRQVADLEQQLRQRVEPTTVLLVRSLLSYDVNRSGLAFITQVEPRPDTARERRDTLMQRATRFLNVALDSLAGAQLVDLRLADTAGIARLLAVVQAPQVVAPPRVAAWQAALRGVVDSSVELTVRSVLVRDADASGFRYELMPDSAPPPAAARAPSHRRPRP